MHAGNRLILRLNGTTHIGMKRYESKVLGESHEVFCCLFQVMLQYTGQKGLDKDYQDKKAENPLTNKRPCRESGDTKEFINCLDYMPGHR